MRPSLWLANWNDALHMALWPAFSLWRLAWFLCDKLSSFCVPQQLTGAIPHPHQTPCLLASSRALLQWPPQLSLRIPDPSIGSLLGLDLQISFWNHLVKSWTSKQQNYLSMPHETLLEKNIHCVDSWKCYCSTGWPSTDGMHPRLQPLRGPSALSCLLWPIHLPSGLPSDVVTELRGGI